MRPLSLDEQKAVCAELATARERIAELERDREAWLSTAYTHADTIAQRDAAIAALVVELAMVERSAPEIHGDGTEPMRSWGASYPLDRVRKLIADHAAAADAFTERVKAEERERCAVIAELPASTLGCVSGRSRRDCHTAIAAAIRAGAKP